MSIKRLHHATTGRAALVSVAILAFGFGAAGPAVNAVAQADPAQAATPPVGAVTSDSGLCLDVKNAGRADGTPVQLYICNGTAAQRWTLSPDLTVRALGRCLTPVTTDPGSYYPKRAEMDACSSVENQKWSYDRGRFVNKTTGWCLDVLLNHQVSRNPVGTYTCNWTTAQHWAVPTSVTATSH